MKSIQETLQQKEQDFKRLEVEIGILRAAQSILDEAEQIKEPTVAAHAGANSTSKTNEPAASAATHPAAPARKSDWVVSSLSPNSSSTPPSYSGNEPRIEASAANPQRKSFP
jgi:hypothetical protein